MGDFLNSVKTATAGGAAETLYTVPAGRASAATLMRFTPVGGSADLTITFFKQADGTSTDIVSGLTLATDGAFELSKFLMQEGDAISFSATNNNIHGWMSWYEQGAAALTPGTLNPRGAWSAPLTLNRFDLVEDDGSTYLCLNDGTTGDQPPSANYMLLAAKGGQGDPGLDGATDYNALTNKPPSALALMTIFGG